jgi:hypothetical protein
MEDAVNQAIRPAQPAVTENTQEQQEAQHAARTIFSLLDQKNPEEAYDTFMDTRDLIKKYFPKQDYTILESTVLRQYNAVKTEAQRFAAVEKKEEVQPISQNNDKKKALTAYEDFDRAKVDAKDKAAQDVEMIYTLLEENNIQQAYEYFLKKQILIKKYVIREVYEVLESTVLNANK